MGRDWWGAVGKWIIESAIFMALSLVGGALFEAHAQDAGSVLKLDLHAELAQRCGITRNGADPTSANLDQATVLRFGFLLDCNAPFRIGVSAQNGALAWIGGARADDGFAYSRDYAVSLDFETSGGAIHADSCGAEELLTQGRCAFFGRNPGEGLSSGGDIAAGQTGALVISWPADGGGRPRRAAGVYQDTITIVVGVRI